MQWTQFAIFIVTMAGMFAYVRSENKEWRREHKEDIAKMDAKIDKIDSKWENLFKLFVELKLKQDK